MKYSESSTILKYLRINFLSRGKCFFIPGRLKSKSEKIKMVIDSVSDQGIRFGLEEGELKSMKGRVEFHAYNLVFCFNTVLAKGFLERSYIASVPTVIEVGGQRTSQRLYFETRVNKIIYAFSEKSQAKVKGLVNNISAGGMGFFLVDNDYQIPKEDILHLDFDVLNEEIKVSAKVMFTKGSLIGCQFIDLHEKQKFKLNHKIHEAIEWGSELHLNTLQRKVELSNKLTEKKEQDKKGEKDSKNYLAYVNPFLESAVSVVDSFIAVKLEKTDVKFERVTSGKYDATTYFDCQSKDFKFQFFLCINDEVLKSISEIIFQEPIEELDDESRDLLGEMGNMIVGNAKNNISSDYNFTISTPALITGKQHVLSSISQYPAVRICFKSRIGDFDVILFINDIIKKSMTKCDEFRINDVDSSDFIEPILNSTINIFQNYLGLDIKEKSLNVRNPLVPKFDVTAFLSIYNEYIEGKIVLNLSRKLALKVYEILVEEKAEEFDEGVKDSVGEILNIITGNAKNEFMSKGLNYQLSTPFIVDGKNQVIKNVGNTPFISTIYWSSEGFFDVCFTLYNKSASQIEEAKNGAEAAD